MLVVSGGASAAGERLLFDNHDYDVTVAGDYACGEPILITVRSARPELFEADSPELQRITDATQAVLGFECPKVDAMQIEGRLAGLGDPVYVGIAERDSSWELETRQSIQSEEFIEHEVPLVEGEGFGPDVEGSGFTVASLVAGMSVDEARSAVAKTFAVESEYDAETGILTMHAGGCPADYDWADLSPEPEPGWKCLQAWFSDQRVARLYLLDLVQVVEATDPAIVEQRLIDRFGEPAHRGTEEREGQWWARDRTIHVLGWGPVVETAPAADSDEPPDVYNLQAKILPVEDVLVVTVTLYQPDVRPGWASDQPGARIPDLTL
jgi:hypothetical protein